MSFVTRLPDILLRVGNQVECLRLPEFGRRRPPIPLLVIKNDFPVPPFDCFEAISHVHRKPSRLDVSDLPSRKSLWFKPSMARLGLQRQHVRGGLPEASTSSPCCISRFATRFWPATITGVPERSRTELQVRAAKRPKCDTKAPAIPHVRDATLNSPLIITKTRVPSHGRKCLFRRIWVYSKCSHPLLRGRLDAALAVFRGLATDYTGTTATVSMSCGLTMTSSSRTIK